MKKQFLYFSALLALLLGGLREAQAQTAPFAEANELRENPALQPAGNYYTAYRVLRLDVAALRTRLASAPLEFSGRQPIELALPLPHGGTQNFAVVESPVLAPALSAQNPGIKTYSGQGLGSTATVRFSLTNGEFNALFLGVENGTDSYIQRVAVTGQPNVYLTYATTDIRPLAPGAKKGFCGAVSPASGRLNTGASPAQRSGGGTLRTFRMAVTTTSEFTNGKGGGTQAGGFAAAVQYINRMVAVYRRELSVSFTLVSNQSLVYTSASGTNPDPFPKPSSNHSSAYLDQIQTVIDTNVGSANYDVGELLGYSGGNGSGGGVAQLSAVCDNSKKAKSITDVNEGAPGQDFTPIYGDQTFCHEIGHQFNMNHSYNSSIPVCTTRNADTAMEPGAGTTIMSYGFTCSNATGNDDYETSYSPFLNFHAVNLAEAVTFIGTISCFTSTNTGNAVPVIAAFTTGRTIPKSTPFVLTGTATDANSSNVLSYSWEGMDPGATSAPGPTVLADPAQAPFFRSYEPAATSTRVFPRLAAILDGTNQAKGDKLPSVGRVVNLSLTVRDNVDGVNEASSAITIDGNSGPFLITSNLNGSYAGNTAQTVTWSVNNTNLAPVSCANVDILLSTDGGQTFPITLLAATPNDGTEPVTMPALTTPTSTARLKVQASNNIFFDISNADFAITAPLNNVSTGTVAGSPFCAGSAASVPYSITGTYAAGNTFTAQLSDASGNFTTPVVIGSVSSVAATGSIAATLPAGTGAGTAYRIRVVASDPAVTGTDNGANLTITAPAVATFDYGPAMTLCTSQTAAQAAVLGTGATAGAFTSTTGLTLNATTGAITPSTSTSGTYTVTNTVAANGGCSAATAMATVTITTPATAGFGYAATSFCTSAAASAVSTLSTGATAGAFTSTTGLTLNATTGAITPSTSTPGTYTITNTVAANGGCAAVTGMATVTITAPATAGFGYAATSFCTSATAPAAATLATGATAGAFTSTMGLTLNASTGAITPSTSTPGTYTITNTVAAAAGCAAVTAPATVTITTPAVATFSYGSATAFCTSQTAAQAAVLGASATAGAFTSTTGLTLNATTGEITPSTSTPSTYTITNTVAAAGGCAAVTATTTLTINAPATTSFSYGAGSVSLCTSQTTTTVPMLATGATAGAFSSTTGLIINTTTGAITPSTSTPGTYTITNTVAANGGCAAVTGMATVTITAPATTGFGYAATSFCTSATAPAAATLATGATAGAFTSTTGLTLNATTGAITPSTSTPGTYTITNTIAAAGGCASVTSASTVTITAPAVATFSYGSATAFCTSQTAAQMAVVGAGATAGAFTSTTGLTLNATTGAITPSTSTPGTYTITNTIAAAGGCASVTSASTVTITAPQSAVFAYPTASARYCLGSATALTPTLGARAVAGTFALTNGTSTGATVNPTTGVVSIGAATTGTFIVTNTLAAAGSCATVVATQTLTVLPLPTVPVLTVVGSNMVRVQGGAVASITYQFLLNGVAVGPASAAASYQLTSSTTSGQYTVIATNANGCASAPSAAATAVYLATASAQAAQAVLVLYPNPAPLGGWAAAELHGWAGTGATLTLYDVLGQAVRVIPAVPTGVTRLPLAGLASGVYLLRAQAPGQQISQRLVIE